MSNDGCPRRFWQDALDGALTHEGAEHLAHCEECARRESVNRAAIAATRADIPPVAEDLQERVVEAVRRQQRTAKQPIGRRGGRRRRPPSINGLPRLAMLCVGIALGAVATASLAGGRHVVGVPRAMASDEFLRVCPPKTERGSVGGQGADGLEGQTVTVAGVWDGQEAAKFRAVLRRFERTTGARVKYVFKTRDIAGTIMARLLRGCPPDIAMLPQPSLLTELARRDALAPLDDVAGDMLKTNYSAAWRQMAEVYGTSYGVWFKAANKSNLWYSKAALRRAGLRVPRTWEQLKAAAGRLARTSGGRIAPLAVAGLDGWTLTDWFENVYLRTAGERRYTQLARGQIRWTHPTVKLALRTLGEVLAEPQWLAGGTRGALETSYKESVLAVFGRSPTAAMTSEGDFVLNELGGRATPDVGVARFPSIGGSSPALVVGGDVAVLFAKSTGNPAARALMRFFGGPVAAESWIRSGGFISPNRRVDPHAYPDRMTRRLARELTSTRTVRFDLSDLLPPAFGAKDGQGMWQTLRTYLNNPSDIDRIAAELQDASAKAAACEAAVGGEC